MEGYEIHPFDRVEVDQARELSKNLLISTPHSIDL